MYLVNWDVTDVIALRQGTGGEPSGGQEAN